ncbi:hypothetical protein J1N35_045091 [Gossypium stocksii]|uniref:Uncharacterized protein n=1 Tax=Gossypium stocksii TaxID=47602 RepID=A0A9D3ZGV5_9ROSI|nr:hypothetical protein J1N35_045091 [Gossypium stocksii]
MVVGWLPVFARVFRHVCGGVNQSAHILSKQDISAIENLVWIEEIPVCIAGQVLICGALCTVDFIDCHICVQLISFGTLQAY